ncbi:MAG: hypothetical protein IJ563_12470 [Selenomonadaceae bacterium]|nr:hypothetical protein [Selenomonadaceae bacterium]MBR1859979.1 hypothetical protein [Selenomonadaceae bacterium]
MSEKKELNVEDMENVAGGRKQEKVKNKNNGGNQINVKDQNHNSGIISNQQGADGTQKIVQTIDANNVTF